MGLLGHHKQDDNQVQFNLKPLTLAVSRGEQLPSIR